MLKYKQQDNKLYLLSRLRKLYNSYQKAIQPFPGNPSRSIKVASDCYTISILRMAIPWQAIWDVKFLDLCPVPFLPSHAARQCKHLLLCMGCTTP
jgi:hypothetical protein